MKKVLSLVLVFVMMWSLSSVGVFAEEDAGSVAAYELKELGIMKGDTNGDMRLEDGITRAEAVALIVRLHKLYGEEVALADIGFTDMEGHWAYDEIRYAKSAGLIDGESETVFDPERKVTYQEFIKMVVSLLGYGVWAEEQGGYPHGYIMCAADIGITDISFSITENALRGDAAKMLLNALDTPLLCETEGENGEAEYTVMNGENGVEHKTLRTMLD